MRRRIEQPQEFLDEAYRALGYAEGSLLNASTYSASTPEEDSEWLEKGDWLTLAAKVGADRVLFVRNDPVFVFCRIEAVPSEDVVLEAYRRIWCMARPQCVFLALPGELRVYSLNQPPARDLGEWQSQRPVAIVQRVADVATRLNGYRREQVETGTVFADGRFGSSEQRADKRLIADLQTIRRLLLKDGLRVEHVHALIGRAIFIRYLEDRGVLTPEYFEQIAGQDPYWQEVLAQDLEKPDLQNLQGRHRRFDRVLRDKAFTYTVFKELASSFNGDVFPQDASEEHEVEQRHLDRLRNLLLGDADPLQPSLFFWAYDFSVIPIELISSIYEEFYHESREVDDKGTHYTPSSLVEYVLSQVLPRQRLGTNPRILDPACGSGIFLVEAFRRIVRFRTQELGRDLNSDELRSILRTQITGIELNREAAHVAAFSLYLALLHYQEPPDILRSRPLPHLLHDDQRDADQRADEGHFGTIHFGNAFGLVYNERYRLQLQLASRRSFRRRKVIQLLLGARRSLDLELNSFDVVIGNPPWFEVGSNLRPLPCGNLAPPQFVPRPFYYDAAKHALGVKKPVSTSQIQAAKAQMPAEYHPLLDEIRSQADDCFMPLQWAEAFDLPVGDSSFSHLFIHRALTFCAAGGIVGLLVHSSTLYNQRTTSLEFRRYWLAKSRLLQIVNFAQVRRLFFEKAVAPFIFACFAPIGRRAGDSRFIYASARPTPATEYLRTVALSVADRRIVTQSEVADADYLWKTYWYGSHRDAALLARLNVEDRLQDYLAPSGPRPGFGFQRGTKLPNEILRRLRPLNTRRMEWYGPLRQEWFEVPPTGVKTQPDERLYSGQRLIAVEGIKVSYGACVRLEYDDFSFRHTVYCVPLPSLPTWQAKVILGTFWSSLGRYRLFMTSPNWGTWHDKITANDILLMPVRMPQEGSSVAGRIVEVVDALRSWNGTYLDVLVDTDGHPSMQQPPVPPWLVQELDEAVYDLFDLTDAERALVEDFAQYKFDLYRNEAHSMALAGLPPGNWFTQGTAADLINADMDSGGLAEYLRAFLEVWNRELVPSGEFRWRVIRPRHVPMVAVVLSTQEFGEALPPLPSSDETEWAEALERTSQALQYPVSRQVYTDGMVRAVTDTDILIIKRDERRLWSRSSAYEDAEATLVQALSLQAQTQAGVVDG